MKKTCSKEIVCYKNWTPQQNAGYRERWQNNSGKELMEIYQVSQRTITSINKHLGLKMKSGTDAEGNQIKKNYRTRKDAYPIGTIVYHYHSRLNKRLAYVITEQGRIRLHLYRWKQAGKEIPEGCVLGFKDLNPENCEIENLILKTRGDVARENNLKAYPVENRRVKEKKVRVENPARAEARRLVASRKQERAKAKEDKIKAKEAKESRLRIEREWQERSRINRRVKRLETKPVDLSTKIAVRINSKTIVYVNPGCDIEQIRQRYLKAS